ncbi:MAG: type I restriction enzyme HsdR N-terminal domain-containing protein [Phycisphaerales bacterium]
MIQHYGYPKDRLRIEKGVYFGSAVHEKRADLVVIDDDTSYTIVGGARRRAARTGWFRHRIF